MSADRTPPPFDARALRVARERLGLTQAQLGKRIGVAANTIARWERGERRMEHPELLRLALERLALQDPDALERLAQAP